MKINGLPVIDGKNSIEVMITTQDVKRSTKKDPTRCAAAIACVRDLGASEARVHVGRTYIRYNGHWERYMTSQALRTEIVSFDRSGKFQPGTYSLLKMTPAKRPTGKRQGSDKPKTYKSKRKYHVLSNIRPMGLTA